MAMSLVIFYGISGYLLLGLVVRDGHGSRARQAETNVYVSTTHVKHQQLLLLLLLLQQQQQRQCCRDTDDRMYPIANEALQEARGPEKKNRKLPRNEGNEASSKVEWQSFI